MLPTMTVCVVTAADEVVVPVELVDPVVPVEPVDTAVEVSTTAEDVAEATAETVLEALA